MNLSWWVSEMADERWREGWSSLFGLASGRGSVAAPRCATGCLASVKSIRDASMTSGSSLSDASLKYRWNSMAESALRREPSQGAYLRHLKAYWHGFHWRRERDMDGSLAHDEIAERCIVNSCG